MRLSEKRGFTLIELLVVIAIIAILAAILFPVISAAKERARVGVCVAQQKQLAAAFLAYADDYNGRTCATYMPPSSEGKYWMQLLFPYTTKKPDLFFCPSLPNWRGYDASLTGSGGDFIAAWAVSIGMSACMGDTWTGVWPLKISEYRSPSGTLVFACSSGKNYTFWGDQDIAQYDKGGCYNITPGKKTQPLLCREPRINKSVTARGWDFDWFDENRHQGNTVVGMLDGRVAVMRTSEVLSAKGNITQWRNRNFSIWDTR